MDSSLSKDEEIKIDSRVLKITDSVENALLKRIKKDKTLIIEDIQDQVELALMRAEEHKVARAYVLYRDQRERSRKKSQKLKDQIGDKIVSMNVIKRDGSRQSVSLDKITNRS